MANLTIGEVRLSYVDVFTARAQNGGEPKYSLVALIPKSNVALVQQIQAAIEQEKQYGVATKFGGTMPGNLSLPLHDGDGLNQKGEPRGEECKGHYVMNLSSKNPPEVWGPDRAPIMNRADIYSGCYGYVSVGFYAYNKNGNIGIGVGLNNVMKTRDGEPIAGKTSAADDFANVVVPVQGQPAYGQALQQPYGQPAAMPNPYGQPAAPAVTPGYPQQVPQASQPQYAQPAPQAAPMQPQYPQQYDPITGQPIVPGGVMGI